MKDYILKYRPFLLFLLQFFASYILLILVYQLYLNQFSIARFEVDGITQLVAAQSQQVLQSLGYTVTSINSDVEPSVIIVVDGFPLVKIIEGCNAVSVMILFASFVVAFNRGFWRTFIFILSGSIGIYVLNVLRISLLTVGLLRFPEFKEVLHDIVFPIFIYGVVFFLWILWIKKFSVYGKK